MSYISLFQTKAWFFWQLRYMKFLVVSTAVHKAVIPEVLSSFTTLMAEFVGQAGHKALEMGILQSPPYFLIRVAVKRIQVHPQRA